MTDQHHGSVSLQPRSSAHQSDRLLRNRLVAPAKQKSTTSLSLSEQQNSHMAMPTSPGPQLRHPRRRSTTHISGYVRTHTMSAHSSRSSSGLTRTGRISKALKGVKVHECDQCGKVYSRAEHLRRHQNNHRTSPLRCKICDRPFFRDDLLSRHVAKYHHPNGFEAAIFDGESLSRRHSIISQPSSTMSEASTSQSIKTESEPYTSSQPTASARYTTLPYGRGQDIATRTFSVTTSPPLGINLVATPYPNPVKLPVPDSISQFPSSSWMDSRFSAGEHLFVPSPASISSPWPSHYQPAPALEDFSFPAEWSNFSSLQSPASNSPPVWDRPLLLDLEMAGFHASSRSSPAPVTAVPPLLMPVSSNGLDESSQDGHLGLNFSKERKHIYLKAYWQHFHPIFPILHKQRWPYKGMQGATLLGFAMMAVGAFFTQEVFAATDSRILLERSLDSISKSNQSPATLPLEVLQAIVLLEFLSQFKAKRATEGLSKMFCEVYDMLWNTHDKHHPKSTVDKLGDVFRQSDGSLSGQWLAWIELHSKERLLAACYILDSRHSLLLARQSHSSATSGLELYVPVPNAVWEALNPHQWAQKLRANHVHTTSVYDALSRIEQGASTVYDPFPSALLVACHAASVVPCSLNDMSMPFPGPYHSIFDPSRIHLLTRVISPHFSARIMSLAAQLISLVPFRALIATSGESWFFSKRLAGDARTAAEEFERLKYQMRSWTSAQPSQSPSYEPMQSQHVPSFVQAVTVALQILNEAAAIPNPHLELAFGPELVVYFASLVLWAATFAALSYSSRRSPVLAEADNDPFEWEFPRAAGLMKDFIKVATTDLKHVMVLSSSPSPVQQPQPVPSSNPLSNAAIHGLIPPMSLPLTSNSAYPHNILTTSVSPPLATIPATAVLPPNPPLVPPPKMLLSWRTGVGAVLRWSASILGGAGHRNSGAGELIEGAISVLEKVGRSGWDGQWF